eukprot:6004935-Prymnesium_polylepis.1
MQPSLRLTKGGPRRRPVVNASPGCIRTEVQSLSGWPHRRPVVNASPGCIRTEVGRCANGLACPPVRWV